MEKIILSTRYPSHLSFTSININSLRGLSKYCDWVIYNDNYINVTNTEIPKLIFLLPDYYEKGISYLVNIILPKIKNKFVLIIASCDYTFPSGKGDIRRKIYNNSQKLIEILINSDYLLHIFVENLDTLHPKMSPILLGLLNEQNIDLNSYNIDFSKKTTLCLCCHRSRNGSGQWEDRNMINNLSKNKWNTFVKFIDKEIGKNEFINELKISKFSFCIHGGGYDPCPRFFECILNGVIPIIQHSPLDEVLSQFPVIFIDKITESCISEKYLLEKYEELNYLFKGENGKKILSLLTLDHWMNIITKKLSN